MITLIFVAFKGDRTQNMTGSEFQYWLKEKPRQICFEWKIFWVLYIPAIPHLLGIKFFPSITCSK
jgi:hypothetical protein